jgi:amicoumacin kinase
MKPVPPRVLAHLAKKCGLSTEQLRKIAGGHEYSDGVIYRAGDSPLLMKIMVMPYGDELALAKLVERFKFARLMGANGVNIVYPLAQDDDELYRTFIDGTDLYLAYLMDYIAGATILQSNWRDRFFIEWGRLVGKMHAVTQTYPIWQYAVVQTPHGKKKVFGWQEEWDFFYDWCHDEEVRAAWRRIKDRLLQLPIERGSYGFIHNDPHAENLLYDGKHLVLLDFDVANCHWFAADISIAMQMTLFQSGGLEKPVQNQRAVQSFLSAFRKGYEEENLLDEFWWQQLDLFIHYRRTLLFCVMQDWMESNPTARNSWKRMILNPPPVVNPTH